MALIEVLVGNYTKPNFAPTFLDGFGDGEGGDGGGGEGGNGDRIRINVTDTNSTKDSERYHIIQLPKAHDSEPTDTISISIEGL